MRERRGRHGLLAVRVLRRGRCPSATRCRPRSIDGPTARKNGGTELLNQIHQKRAGRGPARLGRQRHPLQPRGRPRSRSSTRSGHIDIKGFKVRGNPIYNAFLTNYLGAQVINLAVDRAVHRARARHGGPHRVDADRPDGPELGPLHQVPHPAGLLLHRPGDPGQPEEVGFALAEDARDPAARRDRRTRVSSLRDLQALWKKEQAELAKRGIKTCQPVGRRLASASSPARAPRACSA